MKMKLLWDIHGEDNLTDNDSDKEWENNRGAFDAIQEMQDEFDDEI